MKGFDITFAFIFAILIAQNCTSIKVNLTDQPPKPDLIIQNVTYKRIFHEPPGGGDNVPIRTWIDPPEYEFTITIENKGAGDWWGDFYLKCDYFFLEKERRAPPDYHLIDLGDIVLTFKDTLDIVLPRRWLPWGASRLVFTVNPAIVDSTLEEFDRPEEFFDHNNSFEVRL